MQLACRTCHSGFEVTDADLAFYDKVSPVFAGKKELIPPPTLCPECRSRRRMAFRNERRLYSDHCALCGEETVSVYTPRRPFNVLCQSCWWGDAWDPLAFGLAYDLRRPFREQFQALQARVPRINLVNSNATNATYCNYSTRNRDGYLLVGCGECEGSYYLNRCWRTVNCMDCSNANSCQLCYELVDCDRCYASAYLRNCSGATNCFLGYGLRNCSDCFGCVNLSNQRFHIYNVAYLEGEYRQRVTALRANLTQSQKTFQNLLTDSTQKSFNGFSAEGCSGDHISNARNAVACYEVHDAEDCKYCANATRIKDCHDIQYSDGSEMAYEATNNESSYSAFYHTCWGCRDIFFCNLGFHSESLFGCVGLKRAKYCILNKQYSKAEYEELVPRIIAKMREDGEWGEFFDPSLSPFGYNETVAQEYYPLEKEEALRMGFNWSDYVAPPPQVEKIVKASQLPDSISDVPDVILEWAVECEVSGRPFRIIKQELRFLREQGLPLPRRHPDVRHMDRMKLRNPRKLFSRSCMQCAKPIQTTYAPERPEKVVCEECYLREVY